jgi:uncharacterized protein YkwD
VKILFFFGFLSGLAVVLFLVLRPAFAEAGSPVAPDTAGRAKKLLPEERGERGAAEMPEDRPKAAAGKPLEQVEQQIVALTNDARRSAGQPPLVVEASLHRAARSHGRDMIERAFIDHINPDGLTAEDRVSREDRRAVALVGETIGSASTNDAAAMARRIVAEWIGNPSDRETILRPDYTQIGVGVVPSGSDVRVVQVFARTVARTDAAIPASVARGAAIHVAIAEAEPAVKCDALDVFSPASGLAVLGPQPFGDVTMNVPPGIYKLRFRCFAGGMRKIYSGARLEVTP